MSAIDATPQVVADVLQSRPGNVSAALEDALSLPRHFGGRRVIAREAATYKHPSPRVTTPATSKIVDRVLLDDESTVHQCRTCGITYEGVHNAISHASSHSRTPQERSDAVVRGVQTKRAAAAAATTKPKAQAVDRETAPAAKPIKHRGTGVTSEVAVIIRNLRALANQMVKMGESLIALTDEVIKIGEALDAKPDVSDEEIADLRAKAEQLDMLKNLLNK